MPQETILNTTAHKCATLAVALKKGNPSKEADSNSSPRFLAGTAGMCHRDYHADSFRCPSKNP